MQNEEHLVGWVTPDHTLFIPAPAGHVRDKQAMVLALDYLSDASMMQAASDPRLLDVLAKDEVDQNFAMDKATFATSETRVIKQVLLAKPIYGDTEKDTQASIWMKCMTGATLTQEKQQAHRNQ